MAEAVYILCALTSIGSAALLFRGYRATRTALLFWSSLCFAGLAVNNVMLFVDLVILPGPAVDLSIHRSLVAVLALGVLVFGLVREAQ